MKKISLPLRLKRITRSIVFMGLSFFFVFCGWGWGGRVQGENVREKKKEEKNIWEELKHFLPACQQLTERPHPSEILWLSAWKELVNLSFCLRQGDFKQSGYHFNFFNRRRGGRQFFFFCQERLVFLLENMILLKILSPALLLMCTRISKPSVHAPIVRLQLYKSCL